MCSRGILEENMLWHRINIQTVSLPCLYPNTEEAACPPHVLCLVSCFLGLVWNRASSASLVPMSVMHYFIKRLSDWFLLLITTVLLTTVWLLWVTYLFLKWFASFTKYLLKCNSAWPYFYKYYRPINQELFLSTPQLMLTIIKS